MMGVIMTNFQAGVIGYVLMLIGLLVLLFVIAGCVLAPVGIDAYKEMSPDQIKALQALSIDPYVCTTVTGPPPAGRFTSVLVPRLDKKPDIRFGPDCQIK